MVNPKGDENKGLELNDENDKGTNYEYLPMGITSQPRTIITNGFSIETYRDNPYLSLKENVNINSYQEVVEIIDFSSLMVANHNAKLYIQAHDKVKEYSKENGFSKRVTFTFNQYDIHDSYEYSLFPREVDQIDCHNICANNRATIIQFDHQMRDAFAIFGLTKQFVWIDSKEKVTEREYWTYNHKYDYEITLNGTTIYPSSDHLFTFGNCSAYENDTKIGYENIGYLYEWFKPPNKYHNLQPKRMQAAINAHGECRIIIATTHMSAHYKTDDALCICVRDRKNDKIAENKVRSMDLISQMGSVTNNSAIEDWRYRINSDSSVLEDLGELRPRFVNVNETEVNRWKQSFITTDDLTTLEIEQNFPKTLTAKEAGKSFMAGVVKTVLSNPKWINKAHEKVTSIMKRKKNTKTLPTRQVIGENEHIPQGLYRQFPNFKIEKLKDTFTVCPDTEFREWILLSKDINENTAGTGLTQVKLANMNLLKLQEYVIPAIMANNKISANLIDYEIVYDEKTIVSVIFHGTFAELRSYIPIVMKKATTLNHYRALPFKYLEETDEFLMKDIPQQIMTHPGEIKGNNTLCTMKLLQHHYNLDACSNKAQGLSNINLILQVDNTRLYIIKQTGTVSASCPNNKMKFFDMRENINLFMIHTSCMVEIKDKHNTIRLPPFTTSEVSGIDILHLLSYSLKGKGNWFPHISINWILLIITMSMMGCILVAIIGISIYWFKKKSSLKRAIGIGSHLIQKPNGNTQNQKSKYKRKKLAWVQDYASHYIKFPKHDSEIIKIYADCHDNREGRCHDNMDGRCQMAETDSDYAIFQMTEDQSPLQKYQTIRRNMTATNRDLENVPETATRDNDITVSDTKQPNAQIFVNKDGQC